MKIKYLKDTHDSKAGDIKVIPDIHANILIQLGFVEAFEKPPEYPVYTLVPENARLNLNGTPVIDDFGNISTVSADNKPKKSTAKPKKKD